MNSQLPASYWIKQCRAALAAAKEQADCELPRPTPTQPEENAA